MVLPDDYGAVGNGITDDSAAIAAAAASLGPAGGTLNLRRDGRYLVGALVVPAGVTIEGSLASPDNGGGSNQRVDFARRGALVVEPTTVEVAVDTSAGSRVAKAANADGLHPGMQVVIPRVVGEGAIGLGGAPAVQGGTGTYIVSIEGRSVTLSAPARASTSGTRATFRSGITLLGNAGLEHVLIYRQGMSFPATDASAYAGTAITAAGDGAFVDKALVIGFERPFVSNGNSRIRLIDFNWDSTGPLELANSYDSSILRHLHGWPYGTPGAAGMALERPGPGLSLWGSNDDTDIDDTLVFGHAVNYDLHDTGAIRIGRVWSDEVYRKGSGSIGFRIGPGVSNVSVTQLSAWGSDTGILRSGNPGEVVNIGIADIHQIAGHAIVVTGGDLFIDQVDIGGRGGAAGGYGVGGFAFAISDPRSFVSSLTGSISGLRAAQAVSLPPGATKDHYNFSGVRTDLADGETFYATNRLGLPTIKSGDPLKLPVDSDQIAVVGETGFGFMQGGVGGRLVTLQFRDAITLFFGGNLLLANKQNATLQRGTIIQFMFDAEVDKWRELSRVPP